MKKLIAILLALVLVLAMTACGSEETATPAAEEAAPAATEEAATPAEEAAPAAAEESLEVSDATPVVNAYGTFDKSLISGGVLLTSVGQSADGATMETLLKKSGVEYTANFTATDADLDGIGVLIVATGASTKGLGNAGISIEDETSRSEALLKACDEKGITVIMCHIGGSARRGGTSDQFIQLVMEHSAYMIVVADGNTYDGSFSISDYCKDNSVPLTLVKSMSNVLTPLGEIFG